jgi:DNA helicase HerA-like ATPase
MNQVIPNDVHVLFDRLRADLVERSAIGWVVSCDGARATVAAILQSGLSADGDAWAIGRLVTIDAGQSRAVGMVFQVRVSGDVWSESGTNAVHADVELLGEIIDQQIGVPSFRKGIGSYPSLGAAARSISADDLGAIYAVGASDAVEIGRLSQNQNVAAMVSIHDMLNRHFAVLGMTGVGKSTAVASLIRLAVANKPNLRVMVLDPHNEYANAFPEDAAVFDATTLDLPYWLFRLDELADVVFNGDQVPPKELEILRELVTAAKVRCRNETVSAPRSILRQQSNGPVVTADSQLPYRIGEVIRLIEDMLGKLEPPFDRTDLRSLKQRLMWLYNDKRFAFMFAAQAADVSLERILGTLFRIPDEGRRIALLQLAGLPGEVTNAVASVLARLAFDFGLWSGNQYEILFVCEEAHRYIPQEASYGFRLTRQAIARIAKEGRKYGVYLGVVTQRPGELDPTILSQCSTIFAMRLANDRDKEIIRAAIPDASDSAVTQLSSMGNREAIVFGEGVAATMRLRFTQQDSRRLPATNAFVDHLGNVSATDLRSVIERMKQYAAS